ncbi:MAG: NAD(P)H-hydrate dehydratase, partial [Ginsengibacter sp.]
GDVLTGIITSLLAQHYSPINSCILGVYLHGLAGDLAAKELSKPAMVAGDIIDFLSQGFLSIENFQPED